MPISTIGSNSLNQTSDLTINGQTVGKGGGNVATNTVHGVSALQANTTGSNATVVGYQAGYTTTGGLRQSFFGSQAGYYMTDENTSVGYRALYGASGSTGYYNVAVGRYALNVLTSGVNNVAIGDQALQANTTGNSNTAVGYQAGYSSVTATNNAYFGYQAGYSSTANGNTFIGHTSGNAVTTGYSNTVLGRYSGNQGGLDIRTATNYIVLSDGDGNPRCYWDSNGEMVNNYTTNVAAASAVFVSATATASNNYGILVNFSNSAPNNASQYMFRAVDNTTTCYTIYSNGTTTGRSDARLKKNISDATPKLDDICKLQVRNYEWNESVGGSKEIGLIAQEVETVFPNLVVTHDVEKDGDDYKEVKYSVFVPMLLKAIQELKTIVDAQAAEIAELKAKVA